MTNPYGREQDERLPAPEPCPLPPDNELWDIGAAARFLKMSRSWVYHHVEDGTLPCVRLHGWALRFVPRELRAWVEKNGSRRNFSRRNNERRGHGNRLPVQAGLAIQVQGRGR
ncbi:MAG TPA: helix-turn-helix domain-containing protein [Anaeromyxobacteraceae bacterium]|nr:helix-turn-helix domain-containing protein [Anaeromyxobacteraceae bacterium]